MAMTIEELKEAKEKGYIIKAPNFVRSKIICITNDNVLRRAADGDVETLITIDTLLSKWSIEKPEPVKKKFVSVIDFEGEFRFYTKGESVPATFKEIKINFETMEYEEI